MKFKKLILAICLCLGNLSTVHAASYFRSNGPRWARSTEQYQLSYFGEAFTKIGQGRAAVTYKRNNRIIGNATAAIVNPSQQTEDYKTVRVYDTLNPVAPQTQVFLFVG